MPATPIPNEKAATATTRDGLDLISTTTPHPGKDMTNVLYHFRPVLFKAF